jgi:1-acyl-sn-glycerol-3-phosphate acyltransferase
MSTALGTLRTLAGGILCLVMAVAALLSLTVDQGKGRAFHAVSRAWARSVLFVCGVHVSVQGLDRLDRTRHYVFVSNHASLFDIPCIVAGVPFQIRIVYKKELEKLPVFGWGLKAGPYIAVERGNSPSAARSLEVAIERIRRGSSVLLYAEGTRTVDGKLQAFKRGAFNLAVKAGIPVVPLTVNGSFGIMRKGSFVVHPGTVTIIISEPISVEGPQGKAAELQLMERVRAAISATYVDQS